MHSLKVARATSSILLNSGSRKRSFSGASSSALVAASQETSFTFREKLLRYYENTAAAWMLKNSWADPVFS